MKTGTKGNTNLVSLAFRNLGRHRVKTGITVTAVALGVLFFLLMDAFLLGVNTESKRNLVNLEMGASTICSKAYWDLKDEYPLYEGFTEHERITTALEQAGYKVAPRAVFVGSLISVGEELPFVFIGGDPASEKKVFLYHRYVSSENGGHFMRNGVFEILLGIKGANDLGVGVGDTVRLSAVIDKRDETGRIVHINQVIDLVVAGLINSPDPIINAYTGYVPLDILQDEMGMYLEGAITELIVRKAGAREDELPGAFESPDTVAATLGPVLPGTLVVKSWTDRAQDYLNASIGDIVSNAIFIGIFFIIVLMVIANTVLMAVLERTREIGMLRALGMRDASIIRLFFIETGLIGLFGAVAGVVLYIPLNWYMVNYGFDYSQMMADTGIVNLGYRVVGVFKAAWNIETAIASVVFATLLASVTAYFPSRRAVRMTITDALRMD